MTQSSSTDPNAAARASRIMPSSSGGGAIPAPVPQWALNASAGNDHHRSFAMAPPSPPLSAPAVAFKPQAANMRGPARRFEGRDEYEIARMGGRDPESLIEGQYGLTRESESHVPLPPPPPGVDALLARTSHSTTHLAEPKRLDDQGRADAGMMSTMDDDHTAAAAAVAAAAAAAQTAVEGGGRADSGGVIWQGMANAGSTTSPGSPFTAASNLSGSENAAMAQAARRSLAKWSEEEKQQAIELMGVHGKQWVTIAREMGDTKRPEQIRNFFQNYKKKLRLDEKLPGGPMAHRRQRADHSSSSTTVKRAGVSLVSVMQQLPSHLPPGASHAEEAELLSEAMDYPRPPFSPSSMDQLLKISSNASRVTGAAAAAEHPQDVLVDSTTCPSKSIVMMPIATNMSPPASSPVFTPWAMTSSSPSPFFPPTPTAAANLPYAEFGLALGSTRNPMLQVGGYPPRPLFEASHGGASAVASSLLHQQASQQQNSQPSGGDDDSPSAIATSTILSSSPPCSSSASVPSPSRDIGAAQGTKDKQHERQGVKGVDTKQGEDTKSGASAEEPTQQHDVEEGDS